MTAKESKPPSRAQARRVLDTTLRRQTRVFMITIFSLLQLFPQSSRLAGERRRLCECVTPFAGTDDETDPQQEGNDNVGHVTRAIHSFLHLINAKRMWLSRGLGHLHKAVEDLFIPVLRHSVPMH